MGAVKVQFYTDDYAPGMVQAELVNKKLLARILRHVRDNGGPDESAALISMEDAEQALSPKAYRKLNDCGSVVVVMDPFEAYNLYGYDACKLA